MEGRGKDGSDEQNGVGNEGVLRYLPDSEIRVALLCNAEGARGLPGLVDDIAAMAVHWISPRKCAKAGQLLT